jgi:hypothetical protein
MRHDSDPYIIKKIITETDILQISLDDPRLTDNVPSYLFDELEPFVSTFLSTLDHFAQLHALNPQLSLSRFSANTLEQKLLTLQDSIVRVFSLKKFSSPDDQANWSQERFLVESSIHDSEQLFIALYKKLAQVLETYYMNRVREHHFAALLNDVVGWSEHIEMQGHHDIYAVILFAQKIALDRAVIEHRVEVVRDICMLLQERSLLREPQTFSSRHARWAAIELTRIYSSYLMELYEALLEDMEIIAIAEQDYQAFEQYCHNNQIEVYEEYHDAIKEQLEKYVEGIAIYIPDAFRMIKMANIIMEGDLTCDRYKEAHTAIDILGANVAEDIRRLQHATHQIKHDYPKLAERYMQTLQKIKKLKGKLVKPAIEVYSDYTQEPVSFFERLSQHQAEWIPILEGAMACLDPDDDLYQKCKEVKTRIDQFIRDKLTTDQAR